MNPTTIGLDIAKSVFQAHAIDASGAVVLRRKLRRSQVRAFFAELAPCVVGMEACGSAHYWARELIALGHDVRLIPPIYVKPFVKRGKTDAADAAAICETLGRPGLRYVPVKSEAAQAVLALHKARELLVKQRTMSVNALRAHLAEFGLVGPKGIGRVDELVERAQADETLPAALRTALGALAAQIAALGESIAALDEKIAGEHERNAVSCALAEIPGIGALTASALVASVPDPGAFRSGRDFAAWLGLTPRLASSGGKERRGAITKQGNRALRRLLTLGAIAALRIASKRKGALRDWACAIRARKPGKVAAVALANKLARIAWAVMRTGEAFRAEIFARV